LFLAAALTPFKGIKYLDSKKKERLAVELVIREGLKLGTQNHYLDGIPKLFAASQLLKGQSPESGMFREASRRVDIGPLVALFSVPYF
jgi:tRNA nucleotidyltransferase (CCA-adding enzyme)